MKRTPQKTKHCPVDAEWFVAQGWRYDAMSFTAYLEFRPGTLILRTPASTLLRITGHSSIHIPHLETVGDTQRLCETLGLGDCPTNPKKGMQYDQD